jgi:hypothetical protein
VNGLKMRIDPIRKSNICFLNISNTKHMILKIILSSSYSSTHLASR